MARLSEGVANDVAGTAKLSSDTRHHVWVVYLPITEVQQSECSTDPNDGKSLLQLLWL